MALHIQLRNGIAAAWTLANPILSQGEPGVETDTGQFKIGDGLTAWNSLLYSGATGPAQTLPYRSFGDGSDGNVTISSGTTNLSRDVFYNNLTLSGTGKIITNGYKIFVKSILDISNAQIGAIQWNGNAGNNASGATGGAAQTPQTGGTLGMPQVGATGITATTASGGNGGAGTLTNCNGGVGGAGGNGGTGTSGTGGSGSTARTSPFNYFFNYFETNFLNGPTLLNGGPGGGGAGAGSGDGTNVGGGSGSGGNGGGVIAIYANGIVKSSSTPAGVIQANGGNGGNGGNSSGAGVTGGGAGSGGGGGGFIYLAYNSLFGPVVNGLIQANGGVGGNGGNGFGVGATGGAGGNSGAGGRINAFNVPTGKSTLSLGISNVLLRTELVGTASVINTFSALIGGDGGFNGTSSISL